MFAGLIKANVVIIHLTAFLKIMCVIFADVQIKTKFWGKSMEIQPLGQVNVQLPK